MKPFLDDDIAEIVSALGDTAFKFSGKTILIGGGWGFLGRYFAATFEYLNRNVLAEPCSLIISDINVPDDGAPERDLVGERCRFIKHNVIEKLEVDGQLDFIVNAAAIASPFHYRAKPLETLDASVIGTRNFLDLAKEHNARFVFFSSSEIYGDPDSSHVPTLESYRGNVSCVGPRACYDESKRLGETLCHIYHSTLGVSTNVIRPFNIYGPGMQETDYRVMPNFARWIKADQELMVYGTGNQTRTFCYVSDAINGFLRVIANGVPGEAYNIGNPRPEISVLELVGEIEAVLGRSLAKNVIEHPDSYPADEPNRRCPDIQKAMQQLEFMPSVAIDEGLRRFFQWTDKHFTGQQ